MAAAIALAVVLIVAVAGMSLAMQSQHPTPGSTTPRTPRVPRPVPSPARRIRERKPTPPPEPPRPSVVQSDEPAPKVPELLRTGIPARAKVVNVVDERVVGPVTRSRLTLQIEPEGDQPFEVSIRHAFPTASARAAVRVGGTVPIRYDRQDHHRVLLDPDAPDPPAPA
ncbi:MAG: hypothetical protein ACYCUG_10695 [Acidimicrobiales bacterium]